MWIPENPINNSSTDRFRTNLRQEIEQAEIKPVVGKNLTEEQVCFSVTVPQRATRKSCRNNTKVIEDGDGSSLVFCSFHSLFPCCHINSLIENKNINTGINRSAIIGVKQEVGSGGKDVGNCHSLGLCIFQP